MNIAEILQQSGALGSVSREVGLDPVQTRAATDALLPAILGGFKKRASPSAGGLGGLLDMAGSLGGGGLLDAVAGSAPTPQQPGNDILGQIFGSKDVSRTVAGQAAQTTGIDPSILKKMLPLLAMAVAGYLAKQSGQASQDDGAAQGGGLGGLLGRVLGGGASAGFGGIGSLLDMNGNGNPLDDILGMAGKLGR